MPHAASLGGWITAYGLRSVELGEFLHVGGTIVGYRGEYAAARSLLSAALGMREELLSSRSTDVADTLNNLSSFELWTGDFEAARRSCVRSLWIRRSAFGRESAPVALSYSNLGTVWLDLRGARRNPRIDEAKASRYERVALPKAERYQRLALDMRRRLLPEGDEDIGLSLMSLGNVLVKLARYAEAEQCYLEAGEIYRVKRGRSDIEYLKVTGNIAIVARELGRPETGLALLTQIRGEMARVMGAHHPVVYECDVERAHCAFELDDLGLARQLSSEALVALEARFGPEHALVRDARELVRMIDEGGYTDAR